MRLSRVLARALLASIALPCTHFAQSAPCNPVERRAALLRRADITEAAGMVVVSLPKLFASDGIYNTPGLLSYRGPVGARAWLERDTLNKTSQVRLTTIGGDVSSDGNDGFTYGYLDVIRSTGERLPGWYHAYWRRDANGVWAIGALTRRRRPEGAVSTAGELRPIAKTGCVQPASGADTAAFARAIAAADQEFSNAAGSSVAKAFAAFATPDVVKSGKDAAFVYGRAEVEKLFDPAPPKGLVWKPEFSSAARSGDLGFSLGVAGPRDGTPLAEGAAATGHYFTIWRKEPDGRWRYVID